MGRFILRPDAAADLDGIWDYSVERWGVMRSIRYVSEIRSAIEAATANPGRGRPCDIAGLFKMRAGSHLIIYSIQNDGIDVLRVLHQRMDLARHLTPPPPS